MTRTSADAPAAAPSGAPAVPRVADLRLDIQLLRAVAVGIVVLYHFWPERFPGGFIGVDVFFVVSGLLITDHLLREADRTGGIKILAFWARRVRRLLPLAFVVLLATIALIMLVLPASQQRPGLLGVLWSSVYVQNWSLAASSTDYLARDQAPLLTQHFWSLSAEEQFYLIWPLLLIVGMAIGARLLRGRPEARRRGAALLAVMLVLVVSFVHSVWFTATSPGAAYFATTTRAWEFAAGAALAFVPRDLSFLRAGRTAARIAASWLGYGLIAGTTLLLSSSAPFPSATALLPVVGTALCLLAGDVRRGDPTLLAGIRPVTWIGDLSYGIYLWHWPLLIAAPVLLGSSLWAWQKVVLIAIVVLLAAASKRWVEDPIRFAPALKGRTARSFAIPLIGSAVIAAIVGGSLWAMQVRSDQARAEVEAAQAAGEVVEHDPSLPLVPAIESRGTDYGDMYECFDFTRSGIRSCSYGPEDAEVRIAAFGDSHTAHLLPAMRAAAEAGGWRLTTFVGMSCDSLVWEHCGAGERGLDEILHGDFDAVMTSSFRLTSTPEAEVEATWRPILEAGLPLIAVTDVPWHSEAAFACIDASDGDVAAAVACASPTATALDEHPDPIAPLAEAMGVDMIDLTDEFCDESTCATVVQNTIVYQDSPSSHLTATMSQQLGERMHAEIELRLAAIR